jgi:hypothetical protein
MPLTRPKREYTAEWLAHARFRYEETDEAQDSIAADLGVHRMTLDSLAKKHGWALRKDRPPRDLPQALKLEIEATKAKPDAGSPDAPSVADRLEAAVEKELRKVESLRSQFGKRAHRSIEAERIARTLATLTETLFKVRRLREPGNTASNDDDLPADADGFRINLAQRIEIFVRSRADGSVSGGGEPVGAEPAQP